MNAWIQKEKLRGVEFKQSSLTEEEVHYCEPEQGDILGEDDVERRPIESLTDSLGIEYERLARSLMNSLESSYYHVDVLVKEENKSSKPYVFVTNNLCVIAGLAGDEPYEVVMKKEEK
jgi:hypothetical protein